MDDGDGLTGIDDPNPLGPALGLGQAMLDKTVAAQTAGTVMAPRFEVDPLWPKPLPNHWVLGQTIGVFVDTLDQDYQEQIVLGIDAESGSGWSARRVTVP